MGFSFISSQKDGHFERVSHDSFIEKQRLILTSSTTRDSLKRYEALQLGPRNCHGMSGSLVVLRGYCPEPKDAEGHLQQPNLPTRRPSQTRNSVRHGD